MKRLQDKVAIVTGGSQGIGKEVCLALAKEGAIVAINYLDYGNNQELALQVQEEVVSLGNKAMIVSGNVASYEETEKMIKDVVAAFGRIDILINNAGITRDALLLRMKEADFDAVIDVNLKGTWNCMKQVSKIMMKQKQGRIISMASVVGLLGNPGQVNYCASKAGIIGMSKALARELGPRGVTVNTVAPGFICSDMTESIPEDIKGKLKQQIPLGYFGEVCDIANVICFLASDEARYITGQTISVDGGMAM